MRIRPAVVGDAGSMAKVKVDTWRSAYSGIVPSAYLESLSYEGTAEAWCRGILKTEARDLSGYGVDLVVVVAVDLVSQDGTNLLQGS